MKTKFLSVLVVLSALLPASANIHNHNAAPQTGLTIMVIPYVKAGENIRTVIENDINQRIVISKIKDAFDSHGMNTIDFMAKLKAIQNDKAMNAMNQTDFRDAIIRNSGADVYVQAEIQYTQSNSGNAVILLLSAYEVNTGLSLSSKIGDSGKFFSDDIGKLTERAVESCVDDFINEIKKKFDEMIENGQSITLTISLAHNSKQKITQTLSGDIRTWVSNNALKGEYHEAGSTSFNILFDDIRIPLKDSNNKRYTPGLFSQELSKFLESLEVNCEKSIKGTAIYIKLL